MVTNDVWYSDPEEKYVKARELPNGRYAEIIDLESKHLGSLIQAFTVGTWQCCWLVSDPDTKFYDSTMLVRPLKKGASIKITVG